MSTTFPISDISAWQASVARLSRKFGAQDISDRPAKTIFKAGQPHAYEAALPYPESDPSPRHYSSCGKVCIEPDEEQGHTVTLSYAARPYYRRAWLKWEPTEARYVPIHQQSDTDNRVLPDEASYELQSLTLHRWQNWQQGTYPRLYRFTQSTDAAGLSKVEIESAGGITQKERETWQYCTEVESWEAAQAWFLESAPHYNPPTEPVFPRFRIEATPPARGAESAGVVVQLASGQSIPGPGSSGRNPQVP
jgi:hypothetical protein